MRKNRTGIKGTRALSSQGRLWATGKRGTGHGKGIGEISSTTIQNLPERKNRQGFQTEGGGKGEKKKSTVRNVKSVELQKKKIKKKKKKKKKEKSDRWGKNARRVR